MVADTDSATVAAYDKDAAFAADWHSQPPPDDLHDAVRRYFRAGLSADIGCGSGRDAAWLNANGFPCVGYDASDRLLAEARRRYPDLTFAYSYPPALAAIADASFENVLCETVIMHLPREAMASSVERLAAILKSGGALYLTWRVAENGDRRDARGRLYASVDANSVRKALVGTALLLDEEIVSASSGNAIHRVVARKR